MKFILIALATVPYEYPYTAIAEREAGFIPVPRNVNFDTYERTLEFEFTEDSAQVTVTGTMVESWPARGNPYLEQSELKCDSMVRRKDTVYAYSSLTFVFSRLDARVISAESIVAMRYADGVNYDVAEILARFELADAKYYSIADAGSMVTVGFRDRGGMLLVNLSTGAVAAADLREELKTASKKRSCLFGRK